MRTFTKLTFLLLMINALALKIYESNVANNGNKIMTGLQYKRQENENTILTNSLTSCIRFNLKRLGNFKNPRYSNDFTPLILIRSSKENLFLGIFTGYPESFYMFEDAFKALRDPVSDSYFIWNVYTWHHICFTYSDQDSQIRLVKVRNTKEK